MAKYFLMMQKMAANMESKSDENPDLVMETDMVGEHIEVVQGDSQNGTSSSQEFNATGCFSKSTEKCVKFAVLNLKFWCDTNGKSTDVESMTSCELNEVLAKYFKSVRTKTGELYSISSLTSFRYSLNRYFQSLSDDKRKDIIEDPAFFTFNLEFGNVLKSMKINGADKSLKEKNFLTSDEIRQLYTEVFTIDSPKTLQYKVWFEISTYFTKCGRQKQRYLNKNSFGFGTDSLGKFITLKRIAVESNCQSALQNLNNGNGRKMYEKKNHPMCPVRSLDKYLSKLNPEGDDLFQRPKYKVSTSSQTWYYNQPVGKNYLGNVMSLICRHAGMAKHVSNKCLKNITPEVLEACVFSIPYSRLHLVPKAMPASANYDAQQLKEACAFRTIAPKCLTTSGSFINKMDKDSTDNASQNQDMECENAGDSITFSSAKQEILKLFEKLSPQTLSDIVRWLKNVDFSKDLAGGLVCEDNSQFVANQVSHYNQSVYPRVLHPQAFTYSQSMALPAVNYTVPSRHPLTPLPMKPVPMTQYTPLSTSRQLHSNNTGSPYGYNHPGMYLSHSSSVVPPTLSSGVHPNIHHGTPQQSLYHNRNQHLDSSNFSNHSFNMSGDASNQHIPVSIHGRVISPVPTDQQCAFYDPNDSTYTKCSQWTVTAVSNVQNNVDADGNSTTDNIQHSHGKQNKERDVKKPLVEKIYLHKKKKRKRWVRVCPMTSTGISESPVESLANPNSVMKQPEEMINQLFVTSDCMTQGDVNMLVQSSNNQVNNLFQNSLVDASNSFFNTHVSPYFPDNPGLSTHTNSHDSETDHLNLHGNSAASPVFASKLLEPSSSAFESELEPSENQSVSPKTKKARLNTYPVTPEPNFRIVSVVSMCDNNTLNNHADSKLSNKDVQNTETSNLSKWIYESEEEKTFFNYLGLGLKSNIIAATYTNQSDVNHISNNQNNSNGANTIFLRNTRHSLIDKVSNSNKLNKSKPNGRECTHKAITKFKHQKKPKQSEFVSNQYFTRQWMTNKKGKFVSVTFDIMTGHPVCTKCKKKVIKNIKKHGLHGSYFLCNHLENLEVNQNEYSQIYQPDGDSLKMCPQHDGKDLEICHQQDTEKMFHPENGWFYPQNNENCTVSEPGKENLPVCSQGEDNFPICPQDEELSLQHVKNLQIDIIQVENTINDQPRSSIQKNRGEKNQRTEEISINDVKSDSYITKYWIRNKIGVSIEDDIDPMTSFSMCNKEITKSITKYGKRKSIRLCNQLEDKDLSRDEPENFNTGWQESLTACPKDEGSWAIGSQNKDCFDIGEQDNLSVVSQKEKRLPICPVYEEIPPQDVENISIDQPTSACHKNYSTSNEETDDYQSNGYFTKYCTKNKFGEAIRVTMDPMTSYPVCCKCEKRITKSISKYGQRKYFTLCNHLEDKDLSEGELENWHTGWQDDESLTSWSPDEQRFKTVHKTDQDNSPVCSQPEEMPPIYPVSKKQLPQNLHNLQKMDIPVENKSIEPSTICFQKNITNQHETTDNDQSKSNLRKYGTIKVILDPETGCCDRYINICNHLKENEISDGEVYQRLGSDNKDILPICLNEENSRQIVPHNETDLITYHQEHQRSSRYDLTFDKESLLTCPTDVKIVPKITDQNGDKTTVCMHTNTKRSCVEQKLQTTKLTANWINHHFLMNRNETSTLSEVENPARMWKRNQICELQNSNFDNKKTLLDAVDYKHELIRSKSKLADKQSEKVAEMPKCIISIPLQHYINAIQKKSSVLDDQGLHTEYGRKPSMESSSDEENVNNILHTANIGKGMRTMSNVKRLSDCNKATISTSKPSFENINCESSSSNDKNDHVSFPFSTSTNLNKLRPIVINDGYVDGTSSTSMVQSSFLPNEETQNRSPQHNVKKINTSSPTNDDHLPDKTSKILLDWSDTDNEIINIVDEDDTIILKPDCSHQLSDCSHQLSDFSRQLSDFSHKQPVCSYHQSDCNQQQANYSQQQPDCKQQPNCNQQQANYSQQQPDCKQQPNCNQQQANYSQQQPDCNLQQADCSSPCNASQKFNSMFGNEKQGLTIQKINDIPKQEGKDETSYETYQLALEKVHKRKADGELLAYQSKIVQNTKIRRKNDSSDMMENSMKKKKMLKSALNNCIVVNPVYKELLKKKITDRSLCLRNSKVIKHLINSIKQGSINKSSFISNFNQIYDAAIKKKQMKKKSMEQSENESNGSAVNPNSRNKIQNQGQHGAGKRQSLKTIQQNVKDREEETINCIASIKQKAIQSIETVKIPTSDEIREKAQISTSGIQKETTSSSIPEVVSVLRVMPETTMKHKSSAPAVNHITESAFKAASNLDIKFIDLDQMKIVSVNYKSKITDQQISLMKSNESDNNDPVIKAIEKRTQKGDIKYIEKEIAIESINFFEMTLISVDVNFDFSDQEINVTIPFSKDSNILTLLSKMINNFFYFKSDFKSSELMDKDTDVPIYKSIQHITKEKSFQTSPLNTIKNQYNIPSYIRKDHRNIKRHPSTSASSLSQADKFANLSVANRQLPDKIVTNLSITSSNTAQPSTYQSPSQTETLLVSYPPTVIRSLTPDDRKNKVVQELSTNLACKACIRDIKERDNSSTTSATMIETKVPCRFSSSIITASKSKTTQTKYVSTNLLKNPTSLHLKHMSTCMPTSCSVSHKEPSTGVVEKPYKIVPNLPIRSISQSNTCSIFKQPWVSPVSQSSISSLTNQPEINSVSQPRSLVVSQQQITSFNQSSSSAVNKSSIYRQPCSAFVNHSDVSSVVMKPNTVENTLVPSQLTNEASTNMSMTRTGAVTYIEKYFEDQMSNILPGTVPVQKLSVGTKTDLSSYNVNDQEPVKIQCENNDHTDAKKSVVIDINNPHSVICKELATLCNSRELVNCPLNKKLCGESHVFAKMQTRPSEEAIAITTMSPVILSPPALQTCNSKHMFASLSPNPTTIISSVLSTGEECTVQGLKTSIFQPSPHVQQPVSKLSNTHDNQNSLESKETNLHVMSTFPSIPMLLSDIDNISSISNATHVYPETFGCNQLAKSTNMHLITTVPAVFRNLAVPTIYHRPQFMKFVKQSSRLREKLHKYCEEVKHHKEQKPKRLSNSSDKEPAICTSIYQKSIFKPTATQEELPINTSVQKELTSCTSGQQGEIPNTSTLQGKIPITSTLQDEIPIAITLQGNIPITSTLHGNIPITSTLQSNIPITSTVQDEIPITSTLQSNIPITSTVQDETPITSTVQGEIPNTSTVQGEIPITSTLQGEIPSTLQGKIPITSIVQGEIPSTLQGEIPTISTLQGEIPNTSTLQGNIPITSTVQGEIPITSTVQGEIPNTSTLQGEICNTTVQQEEQLSSCKGIRINLNAQQRISYSTTGKQDIKFVYTTPIGVSFNTSSREDYGLNKIAPCVVKGIRLNNTRMPQVAAFNNTTHQTVPLNTITQQTVPLNISTQLTTLLQTITQPTVPLNTITQPTVPLNTITQQMVPHYTAQQTFPFNTTTQLATSLNTTTQLATSLNTTTQLATSPNTTFPLITTIQQIVPLNTTTQLATSLNITTQPTVPLHPITQQTVLLDTNTHQIVQLNTSGKHRARFITNSPKIVNINTISQQGFRFNEQTVPINTVSQQDANFSTIAQPEKSVMKFNRRDNYDASSVSRQAPLEQLFMVSSNRPQVCEPATNGLVKSDKKNILHHSKTSKKRRTRKQKLTPISDYKNPVYLVLEHGVLKEISSDRKPQPLSIPGYSNSEPLDLSFPKTNTLNSNTLSSTQSFFGDTEVNYEKQCVVEDTINTNRKYQDNPKDNIPDAERADPVLKNQSTHAGNQSGKKSHLEGEELSDNSLDLEMDIVRDISPHRSKASTNLLADVQGARREDGLYRSSPLSRNIFDQAAWMFKISQDVLNEGQVMNTTRLNNVKRTEILSIPDKISETIFMQADYPDNVPIKLHSDTKCVSEEQHLPESFKKSNTKSIKQEPKTPEGFGAARNKFFSIQNKSTKVNKNCSLLDSDKFSRSDIKVEIDDRIDYAESHLKCSAGPLETQMLGQATSFEGHTNTIKKDSKFNDKMLLKIKLSHFHKDKKKKKSKISKSCEVESLSMGAKNNSTDLRSTLIPVVAEKFNMGIKLENNLC